MRTTTATAALGLAASLAIVPLGLAPAAAAGETCDGKAATIVAQPSTTFPIAWVVGTPGDDVIVGTDRRARIDGGGGNDTICGLDSDDHLVGGAGDDRLFGGLDEYYPDDDYFGDVVEPGPGNDYVDLGADGGWKDITFVDSVYADQVSYADATGPVTVDLTALTATGEGTDTFAATPEGTFTGIVGSAYDDVLTGGPAEDQIHGGGGDDVITGAGGDDLLSGDLSWDPAQRNEDAFVPGDDRVFGGPGDDVVEGGFGADVLLGEDGDDYVAALADARGTVLDGDEGDDTLGTGPGTFARGRRGDDELRVSTGNGRRPADPGLFSGGVGRDRVTFESYVGGRITYDLMISVPKHRVTTGRGRLATLRGVEEFIVDGNRGRGLVTFHGGRGPELFRVRWATGFPTRAFGGGGADELIGGNRADLLDGGPGRDRLDGRAGQDRCVRGEVLTSCERRR